MSNKFEGSINKTGNWWALECKELVLSAQGITRSDAFIMLHDTIRAHRHEELSIRVIEETETRFVFKFVPFKTARRFITDRKAYARKLSELKVKST